MLHRLIRLLGVYLLCQTAFAQGTGSAARDLKSEARLKEVYRELPLRFEANAGQINPQVRFVSRERGFNLFLTDREAVMALSPRSGSTKHSEPSAAFRLTWIAGNTNPKVEGIDRLPAKSNYFLGSTQSAWRVNVPNYGRVQYRDIYPGVDLAFYGDQGTLEYDLIVQPRARPDIIHLSIDGPDNIWLDSDGSLVLDLGRERLRFRKPVIYQLDSNSHREVVDGGYIFSAPHEIQFDVRSYDRTRPLIIDPQVIYSSYVGGGADDILQKVAVDSAGNAYTVGFSKSLDFPMAAPFQGQVGGINNVVISKINPSLAGAASLIYSTYLGGSASSVGRGIAIDSLGQVHISGDTTAPNFPVTTGAYSTACRMQAGQCSSDVFTAKLNASGNALLYSTYLGGTGTEFGFNITLNPAGHIFLTGPTDSGDLPVTAGAFQTSIAGGPSIFGDAFVAEVNPGGSGASDLRYLTYLGGGGSEQAWGIAVDRLGSVIITGSTSSSDFPITASNAYQRTYSGTGSLQLGDAFVARLSPAGQGRADLIYSTYLGGAGDDRGEAVAVDVSNLVYVTGFTTSSAFPVLESTAFQSTFGGGDCLGAPCGDAFIVKLDTAAAGAGSLLYSTFFGGSSFDLGHALALDDSGYVYVAGETASTNFPLLDAIQNTCAAGCFPIPMDDVFVAKFDLARARTAGLLFSTYLGGNDVDTAWGMAADSAGNAYVVGQVFSTDFPTAVPFQAFCNNCSSFTANPRSGDGFLFKICTAACTTVNLTVAPRGAANGSTLGGGGSVRVGYAKATIRSGDSPYGVAVFGLTQDGVVISEAGVPASPLTTSARLFIDYGTQVSVPPASLGAGPVNVSTGIALVNPGTTLANITYTLRDLQGRSVTIGHGTLAAGTHRARFIHEFQELAPDFVLPSDFAQRTRFGSLEIASDRPLSILALRLTVNQRGNALLTTVPVADLGQPASSSPLFFPQIADGDGYSTSIVLLNTTNSTQTGTLRFFTDDGSAFTVASTTGTADSSFRYSIGPGGTYLLQTDGNTPGVRVGSAQLIPDAGTTAPVGAGIFSRISNGVLETESGIPSAIPTTRARVFVDLTNNHDSGLAVAAPSTTPLSVTFQAYQSDGVTPVGNAATRNLAGNGHTAAFAGQFIANLPPNFTGVLEISAPTEFAALTLRTLTNARGDFLLTTFPVADLARPTPPASPLMFPQIADGGGYRTEYILLSAGGSSSAAVSFYADDGSPLAVGK